MLHRKLNETKYCTATQSNSEPSYLIFYFIFFLFRGVVVFGTRSTCIACAHNQMFDSFTTIFGSLALLYFIVPPSFGQSSFSFRFVCRTCWPLIVPHNPPLCFISMEFMRAFNDDYTNVVWIWINLQILHTHPVLRNMLNNWIDMWRIAFPLSSCVSWMWQNIAQRRRIRFWCVAENPPSMRQSTHSHPH